MLPPFFSSIRRNILINLYRYFCTDLTIHHIFPRRNPQNRKESVKRQRKFGAKIVKTTKTNTKECHQTFVCVVLYKIICDMCIKTGNWQQTYPAFPKPLPPGAESHPAVPPGLLLRRKSRPVPRSKGPFHPAVPVPSAHAFLRLRCACSCRACSFRYTRSLRRACPTRSCAALLSQNCTATRFVSRQDRRPLREGGASLPVQSVPRGKAAPSRPKKFRREEKRLLPGKKCPKGRKKGTPHGVPFCFAERRMAFFQKMATTAPS